VYLGGQAADSQGLFLEGVAVKLRNEFVYIVNDEANVGAALSTLLRANGKRVRIFTSGQDFLDSLRQNSLRLPNSRSQDAWIRRPGGAENDVDERFESRNLSHRPGRHPINSESDERGSSQFTEETG
jgi:hypothetical protein